jgi:hypothetical protein
VKQSKQAMTFMFLRNILNNQLGKGENELKVLIVGRLSSGRLEKSGWECSRDNAGVVGVATNIRRKK